MLSENLNAFQNYSMPKLNVPTLLLDYNNGGANFRDDLTNPARTELDSDPALTRKTALRLAQEIKSEVVRVSEQNETPQGGYLGRYFGLLKEQLTKLEGSLKMLFINTFQPGKTYSETSDQTKTLIRTILGYSQKPNLNMSN